MSRKIFIIIGLSVFILSACSGSNSASDDNVTEGIDLEVAPIKGALAPEFELLNLEGELVSLSDFRGKSVLVNFWATWCGPCRIEMPAIQSRFETYSPDFVVLAVDNDESIEVVKDFVDELGLSFQVLLDPGAEIQALFRVRGYPTSMFVDPDGVIQAVHIGLMTEGQLDGYLEQVGIGDG